MDRRAVETGLPDAMLREHDPELDPAWPLFNASPGERLAEGEVEDPAGLETSAARGGELDRTGAFIWLGL